MRTLRQNTSQTPIILGISIGLFLLLDITMLALNYQITHQVSVDALAINLAGRQRMLSQRMSKAVFQIDESDLASDHSLKLEKEFGKVFNLFTETLNGFEYGGEVTDAEGNRIYFQGLEISEALELIEKANGELQPIRKLHAEFAMKGLDLHLLKSFRTVLAEKNVKLLKLMNNLTVTIEKASNSKTARLRLIQSVTFLLALINFIHIILLFRRINRQSEELIESLQTLFEGTNAALIVFSQDGRVLQCNGFAVSLFGYSDEIFHTLQRDDLILHKGNNLLGKKADQSQFEIDLHSRVMELRGEHVEVVTLHDISHHKSLERRLAKLANHDELTGLYNRRVLPEIFAMQLARAREHDFSLACIFADLDGFKLVNDQYGHDAGDVLLKVLGSRLVEQMRSNDLIFRYGGDEFVLLVPLHDPDHSINRIAGKIVEIFTAPVRLPDDRLVNVDVSAGIAIFPQDAQDPDSLLVSADAAMYEVKKQGGGVQRFGHGALLV